MTCPNCKQETQKITTVPDDEGGIFSFCSACPRPKVAKINFPTIMTSKNKRGRPKRVDSKFNSYQLSAEEIAQTQAARPNVVVRDNPVKRELDKVDGIGQGQRVKVFMGGDHGNRQTLVRAKIMKELKTENFRVLSDDGLKVVAEAVK